ncbi:hypothetical protein P43SY_010438 [Pythium insidiosum]|uniref:PHD-type domain-containing protein n=1 Tax=Pythium insidiosum TaxID=114742 RepID=A0AAD5L913_PYTIN|nr:hypothetical protein P43SY_010438 [Pythium insidiosum]
MSPADKAPPHAAAFAACSAAPATQRPTGQRQRRVPVPFSPADEPPRPSHASGQRRRGRPPASESQAECPPDVACRRLEARIRSLVKQLKFHDTFVEAYEAQGWRNASREKLKPSQELAVARRKILLAKRSVRAALKRLQELQALDPRVPYLVELSQDSSEAPVEFERICCSRCNSTDTTEHNDILLCDAEGCFRAFHQRCQIPEVRTEDIPSGDEPWFCPACLALFNALKCLNYAFGTTWEHVDAVFPELPPDNEGDSATTDDPAQAQDAEDEDDEDFSVKDDGSASDNESDSDGVNEQPDDGISEDELQYLQSEQAHNAVATDTHCGPDD